MSKQTPRLEPRILSALALAPMTSRALRDALTAKRESIDKALRRLHARQMVRPVGVTERNNARTGHIGSKPFVWGLV